MKLELIKGLSALIPNVSFSGDLRTNTERAYDSIVIISEIEEKPLFSDVYEESLSIYKREKTEEIDDKTTEKISYGFRYSGSPEIPFKTDLAWQFNTQSLFGMRTVLTYPYNLKASSDKSGMPLYISITSVEMFGALYNELYNHINTWLNSGWIEKSNISSMTEIELDSYVDGR